MRNAGTLIMGTALAVLMLAQGVRAEDSSEAIGEPFKEHPNLF